jgi:hypothetical protein
MQRAARQATRRQENETSDTASGATDKTSATERNERFSERRGGQGVIKTKKQAIQRAARRAMRHPDKETSDSASGAASKTWARERNKQ